MRGIDRADQYLSYYSVLRKTVKWSKKVVLYLLNCALFNAFFVYRTLNTNKKVKYKNFLHEVGRSWISEVQNRSPVCCPSIATEANTMGGLNMTRKAQSLVISEYANLKNCCWWGGKKEVSCTTMWCVLHITSKVKLDTIVNYLLFRFTKESFFEKYHSVKDY